MKNIYYYSKSTNKFIEIKNFKSKLLIYFTFIVLTASGLFFAGYLLISSFSNSHQNAAKLAEENERLKTKMIETAENYRQLNNELNDLVKENNSLRIAVNLPPLSDEERMVGVGGGYFDNYLDFASDDEMNKALSFIDEVSRKISFEKANYLEISDKLTSNKNLYKSLPAIKPCNGILASHGFGMREHPILNISKMHEGIDIITDIGTSVYASGDGVIDFVGISGGYGLTVEINHGFGYRTIYAHLSSASVKPGKKVKRGTLIAKTGNSGLSSGPHLHYEVHHDGVKLNPSEFFFDDINLFEFTSKN